MIAIRIATIGLALVLSAPLAAQPPDRSEQIDINFSKLQVTVAMDHHEYFPGEIAEITITVTNPTWQTLEIPQPFVRSTGVISQLAKNNRMATELGAAYGPMGPGPYVVDLDGAQPEPTIMIKPGETLSRTLHSYDRELTTQSQILTGGAVPNSAGEFRLTYWSGQFDFNVTMPVFEGMVAITSPEWKDQRPRFRETVGASVYAFVLSAGGKHYLCLEKEPYAGRVEVPKTDAAGKLVNDEFHFNRYSRIAESDNPIVSLKGEADPLGNVLLTWGEAGERRLFIERSQLLSGTQMY